jgi:hypothetical protein
MQYWLGVLIILLPECAVESVLAVIESLIALSESESLCTIEQPVMDSSFRGNDSLPDPSTSVIDSPPVFALVKKAYDYYGDVHEEDAEDVHVDDEDDDADDEEETAADHEEYFSLLEKLREAYQQGDFTLRGSEIILEVIKLRHGEIIDIRFLLRGERDCSLGEIGANGEHGQSCLAENLSETNDTNFFFVLHRTLMVQNSLFPTPLFSTSQVFKEMKV